MRNEKKRPITIKQLADIAGVSFSTVAKALRDDPVVKEKTKKRIQALAKEFNYYPNVLAKGLRSKKTGTIGVILNDIQSPFYSEIYKAIGDVLIENDYTMLLCDSSYSLKQEKKNIITMISQGVDGIIISSVSEKSDNIKLLIDSHLRSVFIDNIPEFSNINYVYVNHEEAAGLAVEHLIQNGHKNILLLNGPKELSSSQHFLKGYLTKLQEYDITPQDKLIKYGAISVDGAYSLFERVYNGADICKRNDFTAIITLSDVIAIGIYEAAHELHFTIPDDYSVIGYDNILMTKYLSPPLTTIHQPKKRTGEYSVKLLLEQINFEKKELKKIILSPQLIVRNSVKNIRSTLQ